MSSAGNCRLSALQKRQVRAVLFDFFRRNRCHDDALASGASVLWGWLKRCLESPSAPDTTLLGDAVPEGKDSMRILAVLADKTMRQVEGLHLSLASLDARCGGCDVAASCYFR